MAVNISEKYKKIILALIIIILAIAGILYYNKIQNIQKNQNNQNNKEVAKPAFVAEIDPKLSAEDRRIIEEKLASAENKIKNPPDGSTDDDKYRWSMDAGFQKLTLGKFLEAKDYFLAASGIRPTYYAPEVALYQTYIDMTDYNSARGSIKKALTQVPNSADIWRKYIQLEKEKFNATNDDLEKIYSDALKSTGNNVDIITVYAQFLESTGDLKGAIEQWKKAIETYSQSKNAYQAEITRIEGLIKK